MEGNVHSTVPLAAESPELIKCTQAQCSLGNHLLKVITESHCGLHEIQGFIFIFT